MSKSSRIANTLLAQANGAIGKEIPIKEKKNWHHPPVGPVAIELMDNLPSAPIYGSTQQLFDSSGQPWVALSREAEEDLKARGMPIPKPIIKKGEGKVHTKPISQDLIQKIRGKLK